MISFHHRGNFDRVERFFDFILHKDYKNMLRDYGEKGVVALSNATPKDSGKTATSWSYDVKESRGTVSIVWYNSNVNKGVNIAVILQYGHGTQNGGYVVGRDYINPTLQPLFDEIASKAWEEVTSK